MNTTNTIDKIDSIENQKNYIVKLVQRFFNADGVWYYCGKGEKQCSDCSVLYTIWKNNTWKISLIKVGIWEFNCNTFLEVKWFKDSPVPLFVINS